MARQINFEVQINQGGRWTIHARFPSTGREEAIEEAKQIGGLGSVRVLRDEYNSETGTSSEYTIYKSGDGAVSHGKSAPSPGTSHGSPASGYSSYDEDDDEDFDGSDDDWMRGGNEDEFLYDEDDENDKPKKQKKEKSKSTGFTALIVKLLFIILLAVGLAATVVAVMSPYIDGINLFGVRMTGAAKENALIVTFLATFLTTAIILSSVLLSNTKLKERKRKARPRSTSKKAITRSAASQQRQAPPAQTSELPAIPIENSDATLSPSGIDTETKEMAPVQETDSMSEFREAASEISNSVETADPSSSSDMATEQDSEESKRGVVLSADDFPMLGEQDGNTLSPHGEKQKKYMMGFIDKALTAIGKDHKSMSNFDKFGVSLFLAGACETLGQKHELSDNEVAKIMADSVQTMGFKRSHAKTFAEKYDEYLVQDPTYMQMFQAGRNSLATYLTDEGRIEQNMVSVMAEWNKPKAKEAEAGPITVLFTDIAGSTAMTQNLGDAGAQQVVRAHNRVVREALTMWNGKEVKHTGDGIMASFVKTSDSLDAAMQMQREATEYTEQNPDKPLHLKIGINAGEPISEDNDLFGSTVQMSARIVDKAQAEEIFVSEIVRGICAGKTYKFVNRGTYPMKGFDTDPVLYEVVWREEE